MTHAAAIFKLRQFLSTDLGNIDYLSFSFRGDFEFCHAFSLSFTTVCSMVVNDRAGTRELPIEPRGSSPDDRISAPERRVIRQFVENIRDLR